LRYLLVLAYNTTLIALEQNNVNVLRYCTIA
jgi:hypothetical protein